MRNAGGNLSLGKSPAVNQREDRGTLEEALGQGTSSLQSLAEQNKEDFLYSLF